MVGLMHGRHVSAITNIVKVASVQLGVLLRVPPPLVCDRAKDMHRAYAQDSVAIKYSQVSVSLALAFRYAPLRHSTDTSLLVRGAGDVKFSVSASWW